MTVILSATTVHVNPAHDCDCDWLPAKAAHLSKANIHSVHLSSAVLQEAVSETPSGQASIQARQACHIDVKM